MLCCSGPPAFTRRHKRCKLKKTHNINIETFQVIIQAVNCAVRWEVQHETRLDTKKNDYCTVHLIAVVRMLNIQAIPTISAPCLINIQKGAAPRGNAYSNYNSGGRFFCCACRVILDSNCVKLVSLCQILLDEPGR